MEQAHHKFGHLGVNKMMELLSPNYIWPKINQDIAKYVKRCEICIKNKTPRGKPLGELSWNGPAKEPFDIVSIDTVGGFSSEQSRKQYAHLAIDHFTRFVWVLCSKTQSAKNFINLIKTVSTIVKPKKIIADRYAGIKSKEFILYLEKNKIDYQYTPTDCPQSNGMVERVNQTLVNRLRCKRNEREKQNCTKLMEEVVTEYNDTLHTVTTFSPNYLLYGKRPFEPPIGDNYPSIEEAREIALENSIKNHNKNKAWYDKRH